MPLPAGVQSLGEATHTMLTSEPPELRRSQQALPAPQSAGPSQNMSTKLPVQDLVVAAQLPVALVGSFA